MNDILLAAVVLGGLIVATVIGIVWDAYRQRWSAAPRRSWGFSRTGGQQPTSEEPGHRYERPS